MFLYGFYNIVLICSYKIQIEPFFLQPSEQWVSQTIETKSTNTSSKHNIIDLLGSTVMRPWSVLESLEFPVSVSASCCRSAKAKSIKQMDFHKIPVQQHTRSIATHWKYWIFSWSAGILPTSSNLSLLLYGSRRSLRSDEISTSPGTSQNTLMT